MTYTQNLIPPHGGYQNLKSYQNALIVYDFTVAFCDLYRTKLTYKTYEQMIGAARSGKQIQLEGSQDSGISKKIELKLFGTARGSLEELKEDYLDFLRHFHLKLWDKDDPRIVAIRKLAYTSHRSYLTYKAYLSSPESAANCAICLIHQTNYLLDQLLKQLELEFQEKGGFTERLYRYRKTKI